MGAELLCLFLYERAREVRFVEGAFVCSDPCGVLHTLLRKSSSPRRLAATHCVFLRRHNVVLRGDESVQHEARFDHEVLPHVAMLGGHHRTEYMRLALFYSFRAVLPDGSTPRFTYVKMERWPCVSFMHAAEAFQTYVLGAPCCPEQPNRCEGDRYSMWEEDAAFVSKLGAKAMDEFNEYNMHVRAGNELFIPSELVPCAQW